MSTATQRAEFVPWFLQQHSKQFFAEWYERPEDVAKRLQWAAWQAAQASQAAEIEALRNLLNEVRACFTRDDDLPDDLLPRIDAAMQTKEAS